MKGFVGGLSLVRICRWVNLFVLLGMAVYFGFVPCLLVARHVRDPGLRGEGIPRLAFRLHRALTPRHDQWARKRIETGRPTGLRLSDISGTEWPLFGSVFYLWSTEALQAAWEEDPSVTPIAPKVYAREAVESAKDLVIDPGHAAWVQQHWGDDYLERENLFHRTLVIAALTAHYELTGDRRHLPVLRRQVLGLARELDESPYGLLDDCPGQCYPGDVMMAIACIRRADGALGTDHTAFVDRALRAFAGAAVDPRGLPPYAALARRGVPVGPSRGCANSFLCTLAPELWPEAARRWYAQYEEHFWQNGWGMAGFREFPKAMPGRDWYIDVDAGPCAAGLGAAACAFGVAAARVNGRFDHAYPLAAEMVAASWPLANGRLAMPAKLSDQSEAPYLGECCVLFCLTRQPRGGSEPTYGGTLPGLVWIMLALYAGAGILAAWAGASRFRAEQRAATPIPLPRLQAALWALLILGGILVYALVSWRCGLALVLSALFLPRGFTTPRRLLRRLTAH